MLVLRKKHGHFETLQFPDARRTPSADEEISLKAPEQLLNGPGDEISKVKSGGDIWTLLDNKRTSDQ